MTSVKFCRFSSDCGPESRCRNNLFGLIRSKCVSTKGSCRFDSSCPKYYQCVGNTGGLTTGKCLLAISKSNPLSKSISTVSNAVLDPASIYRKTHVVNITPLLVIVIILIGVGYFIYQVFIKPYPKSNLGSCFTSVDCGLIDNNLEFQCGQKIYNTKNPPDVIDTKEGICDCTVLQGGGRPSRFAQGFSTEQDDDWIYKCDCDSVGTEHSKCTGNAGTPLAPVLLDKFNCRRCKCWCPHEHEWRIAEVVVHSSKPKVNKQKN